jgi:DNA-binding LacI/PurR family transcriptional regulator
MAFGVVRAAMEKNLRIPDDLSLVGYDNVDLAGILYPPLTTVHQPKHDIGTKGIELLLNLAADRDATPASHFVLPVELVERQSCRALGEALQVRSAGHSD